MENSQTQGPCLSNAAAVGVNDGKTLGWMTT
jgi:hypothetical protein